MDDKKRRKLLIDLVFKEDFDTDYSPESQSWFVEKIIRGLEAEGLTDSAVEQKAREVVKKANALVKANRDFSLVLSANGNPRFTKKLLQNFRRHRVETLYGAIAFNREFVEPQNLDYLLFVAKRRLRTVLRMYTWVNPNIAHGKREGYWAYPEKCPGNSVWRVNQDAQASWQPKTSGDIPIAIKSGGNPVTAINQLFAKRTSDACKGNLFDCAVTAEIMFIDSLLEAKAPATFLNALPSGYIEINHMDHSEFAQQPLDNKNVLKRVPLPMPVRDLQVGDHCYIYNHPLYKTFRPTGSWTGEFSFVYICGDRNHRSQKGFVFGGHGKNGTLSQFYNAFVDELTTYLALSRKLSAVHLTFMRGGSAAIAPGTVSESEDDIQVFDVIANTYKPAASYRLLEYAKTVEPRDFTKIPDKTKRKPASKLPSFLVLQSKTEDTFYLALVDSPDPEKPLVQNLRKKAADLQPANKLRYPIKFERMSTPPVGANASVIYAAKEWGVAFTNRANSREEKWALYVETAGQVRRHELRNDKKELDPQLFEVPFAQFNSSGTDIEVYLPKIDFGSHSTFLIANGAF